MATVHVGANADPHPSIILLLDRRAILPVWLLVTGRQVTWTSSMHGNS